MNQNGEEQDKELIQVIKQAQSLLEEYQKKLQQDLKIILLIGMTGAGKSAIFNFLAGAEFIYIENDEDGDEMKIKEFKNTYSKMNDGLTSVTTAPNYYFCEYYQHLLIDFPGFFDTRGKLIQLLIQMIFNKIVSQTQVKVVYVLRHPENTLSDRGYGFQDFLKQIFKNQKYDISKFTIILNSYSQQLQEDQLKKKFQESELEIFEQVSHNIQVIRKVKDDSSLKQIFSPQRRRLLWSSLIQANQIQFITDEILNIEELKQYLLKKHNQWILSQCELIREQIHNNLNRIKSDSIMIFFRYLNSLIDCLSKDMRLVNFNSWYMQFQDVIQQIYSLIFIFTQSIEDQYNINQDYIQMVSFLQKQFQCYQEIFLIQEKSIYCCEQILKILNVHHQKLKDNMEYESAKEQLQHKISQEELQSQNFKKKIQNEQNKGYQQEQRAQNLQQKIQSMRSQQYVQQQQFNQNRNQQRRDYDDRLRNISRNRNRDQDKPQCNQQ